MSMVVPKRVLGIVILIAFVSFTAYSQANTPRYKIGLAFGISGRGDRSFNDSAYDGLVEVARTFNGYFANPADPRHGNELEIKYLTPPNSTIESFSSILRQLAREQYQLIFAIGIEYSTTLPQIAREFPNSQFVLIDATIPNLRPDSNITVVNFKEHEGSFLVGMIAGMKNNGGKVGFIGGMNSELIQKFEYGFRAGVIYSNPELKKAGQVLVEYIGNTVDAFNNPNRAYQIARNMYQQGATIIFHAAGASGLGVFRAARERKQWAIGVDSDQGMVLENDRNPELRELAPWILTSMLKRVNRPIFALSRDFIRSGKIQERYQNYGFNFDAIGFAINDRNREILGRDVNQRVIDIRAQIGSGQLQVPSTRREFDDWIKTLN